MFYAGARINDIMECLQILRSMLNPPVLSGEAALSHCPRESSGSIRRHLTPFVVPPKKKALCILFAEHYQLDFTSRSIKSEKAVIVPGKDRYLTFFFPLSLSLFSLSSSFVCFVARIRRGLALGPDYGRWPLREFSALGVRGCCSDHVWRNRPDQSPAVHVSQINGRLLHSGYRSIFFSFFLPYPSLLVILISTEYHPFRCRVVGTLFTVITRHFHYRDTRPGSIPLITVCGPRPTRSEVCDPFTPSRSFG